MGIKRGDTCPPKPRPLKPLQTYWALFAGFDLAGKGLEMAGLSPLHLFEYDEKLASVGQNNSTGTYVVADVRDVSWQNYPAPDVLWASPVCTRASNANNNKGEAALDIECAHATCRAIAAWRSPVVVIENVWGYRKFESFGAILDEHKAWGYSYGYFHLNSADFGVPQTRKRLILIGIKGEVEVTFPPPTHAKGGVSGLLPWKGWYEAVEDLLPDLPDTQFAPWQLKRLEKMPHLANWLFNGQEHEVRDPSITITAGESQKVSRAILVNEDSKMGIRPSELPAATQMASERSLNQRAFVTCGMANTYGTAMTVRIDDEHRFVVNAQTGNRQTARVGLQSGRVVSMTPRALARFMSLPDEYRLSGVRALDGKGLGNGVPCLLAKAVFLHAQSLLEKATPSESSVSQDLSSPQNSWWQGVPCAPLPVPPQTEAHWAQSGWD